MGNYTSFSTFLIFMPLKTLKGNRYDKLDVPGRFCHKMKRAAKQNSLAGTMPGENQIKILTKLSTSHGARCLFWHQWKSTTVGDNNSVTWQMVFCCQNCSDLLWEKIVLGIEKNFWNSRLKAENFQTFWDHLNNLFKQWKVRTISGNRMLF